MKIVIGYDGSKAANAALKDLRNAGLAAAAEVRIVHAVAPLLPLESLAPVGNGITWYAEAYREAYDDQKRTVDHALAQAKEAAKLLKTMFPKWKVIAEATVDHPAHAVLEAAAKAKADLIVVGSTGWNLFTKAILGSVADKILNHAHCTVRLGKGSPTSKPHAPRLLIAFDGSEHAKEAVRQVAARSWPRGTRALILAVSEFQLRMGDLALALTQTLGTGKGKASPWPWMDAQLAKAATTLTAAGILTDTAMVIDEPRRAILIQARKFKADTIVMGTHGHSGLSRFLLGSVSASVSAHAPCSVEIARAETKAKAKANLSAKAKPIRK
ncbi:MAG: universal stress protein [Fibrobacteria bacterium]